MAAPEATFEESTADDSRSPHAVERYRLTGSAGAWEIDSLSCSIGSHPSNRIVIADRTISRFHCEISLEPRGPRVRDLGSRNGVSIDGVPLTDGFLRAGSEIRLGRVTLRFEPGTTSIALPLSERTSLGPLVGSSPAMRIAFAQLEGAARSNATVLIEGETGAGKEGAAEALHFNSARADKPLIVVDCGSIPESLMESELFGHEKGSFTGASSQRKGAVEEANGGTLFLDEVGELPLDLQPKLLRFLEQREFRRIGSSAVTPVDVRVVAATHRDLREAVNRGTFRADLYFRLAVVRIELPPLRKRLVDLPMLVERLLLELGAPEEITRQLLEQEFLATLTRSAWPGNVRELRNHLERCLVFRSPLALEASWSTPLADAPPAANAPAAAPRKAAADKPVKYAQARRQALDEFERAFLEEALRRNDGKVAAAAQEASIDRVYLYRLLRRHGLPR